MCVLLACMHIHVCKFYGFVEWQCLFFLLQPCFGDFVKVSCFSVFKAGSAWDYSTVVNFSKNGLAWRPYSSVTNLSGILNALLSLISQLAFPNGHICLCPTKYSHSHYHILMHRISYLFYLFPDVQVYCTRIPLYNKRPQQMSGGVELS